MHHQDGEYTDCIHKNVCDKIADWDGETMPCIGCKSHESIGQEKKEQTEITPEFLSTTEPCEVFQFEEKTLTIISFATGIVNRHLRGTSIKLYPKPGTAIIEKDGTPVAFALPDYLIVDNSVKQV